MKINKFLKKVDDSFLSNNDCIFKKYKPVQKIGSGSFGKVYLTKRIKDEKLFAMKTEKKNSKVIQLEKEAYFLYTLQGFGIPKFITYGRTKNYNILIETLLNKNLNEIMKIQNNLSLQDVCLIGIQILDRLEWIHSKDIIYRDIKPENFLIGKDDPNVIYIIDFGLCKKYRSSKTGKHILPRKTGFFYGTIKYSSIYALIGKEPSRRDDLIALGYLLIFLYKGSLPWDFKMKEFNNQILGKILNLKRTNSNGTLFNNLPKEFNEYINYNNNLKFEQEPDYKYLHSLFNNILFRLKFNYKNMSFSWITSEQINIFRIPKNNCVRKSSSHSRLFQIIAEKSAQRAKNEFNEKYLKNNITNTIRNFSNSPISKIKKINNIKNINNINFKNNEEIISIQSNENIFKKPSKIKKITLEKKFDNSNSINNSNRNNDKLLPYNSNNSKNNNNKMKNQKSYEPVVNINSNRDNKNNLFFKNQSKLSNKKIYLNNQKIPKLLKSNTRSNINIIQNSFDSTSKGLIDKSGIKTDYSFKNIQSKNLKKIFLKNQINKNIRFQRISLSNYIKNSSFDSKISNKNIDNHINFGVDKSNIHQNKTFANNNIKIIYFNNNYNYFGKKNNKSPISHLPNNNIMIDESKYFLKRNQKNGLINLKNKNILNKQSIISINSYKMKQNQNNTYKSIFKRNEGDTSPFSEYITPFYDKYY